MIEVNCQAVVQVSQLVTDDNYITSKFTRIHTSDELHSLRVQAKPSACDFLLC